MTYDELVTAVSDYSENVFPTEVMNTMIRQAEQRIYNTVQAANQRKNVTGSLTSGNKYLQCPVDFLSVYSLAIYPAAGGSYEYLLDKDVNFIRQAYPNPATTGKPKHYAIFGPRSDDATELTLILGPTPNANYSAELHYFAYPESIVTAGETWLGENFDSALLNGTMVEAITYMKGEETMVKLYAERYLSSIALLKNLADGKQRTDAYRTGQVRVKVN
jgi:hypothetical protein